jgi:HSP20 family protein
VRSRLADPALASGTWTPLADVYETADAFVVQLEVPGIAEEDIEVHVDGDNVVVRGRRQPVSRTRPDSFHRMERSYGAFSRSFQLPQDVDPDRVTARFKDGLLRVELPKLHARGGWRLREKA